MENTTQHKIKEIIDFALTSGALKKIIFSSPSSAEIPTKCEGVLFEKGAEHMLGLTSFTNDNKATRKNYTLEDATLLLFDMTVRDYKRTNIITHAGKCSVMVSKKGKITLLNKIKFDTFTIGDLPVSSHNKQKNYIITPENSLEFLSKLGVCSDDGKIFDKKMSKYRQINKFLEIIEDIYPELPTDGELNISDLCCGKSYLSFAVYHYLCNLKGRSVKMYAVDLKADVIEFCRSLSEKLGYRMEFICDDIANFKPQEQIHMVVSLHACDIATDIVISNAVRLGAKVILSTPCCHHEMQKGMKCDELSFITKHSILKQKLADAATDAMRCLALEYYGYEVTAFELIDPEETPKNVIIKGIYRNTGTKKREKALDEFNSAAKLLGITPFIGNILPKDTTKI